MSTSRFIKEAFLKGRFSALLISLAVLLLFGPLIPGDQGFTDKMFGVLVLVVLVTCLRAVARTRRFFWFMVFFTLLNVVMGSFEILSTRESDFFLILVLLVRIIYFLLAFFSIMSYVLDDSSVTADKICGAVSAYMVLGIAWSFVYSLFYQIDPASFKVPAHLLSTETVNSTWTLYFSYTTLTTLGYGDITPVTPAAQSYTIMEAATGQMFVAVIIARLIALHITHQKRTGDVDGGM